MTKHRSRKNNTFNKTNKTLKQQKRNKHFRRSIKKHYTVPRIPQHRLNPMGPPKVALLFLTKGNHEQPSLWEAFLKQPHTKERFSVYCHCASPKDVPHDSFLRQEPSSARVSYSEGLLQPSHTIPKPYNRWGHLVLAYYQLLHRAYHDTNSNHQRFVFLSETCVPCVNAQTAYSFLTQSLATTYMDSPRPEDNVERYEQVVHNPWLSMWPWKVNAKTKAIASQDCSKALQKAGILKDDFFKHSGWFSPNREDTFRLLQRQTAFEALNIVSAGDEHILSILRNRSLTPPSQLKQHRVTFVQWDYDKIQKWEALKQKESEANYWDTIDNMKVAQPKQYQTLMAHRNALKDANMHPIEYTKTFSKKHLKQCLDAKSIFVRKVRQSCNIDVLMKHIS